MTGCERLGPAALCREKMTKRFFEELRATSYELKATGFGFFLEARGSWLEAS
jgi:hypothetical protein